MNILRSSLHIVLFISMFVAPMFLLGQQIALAPVYERSCNKLEWSVAGNEEGLNPPVLSQLIWNKIMKNEYGLSAAFTIRRFEVLAVYCRSAIAKGEVDDIDYKNNGELLQSRRYNSAKGNGYSFISGLRYFVYANTSNLKIGIDGGYKARSQKHILTGKDGSYQDLRSSYTTKWSGAYLGAVAFLTLKKFRITSRIENGLYQYDGEGNWNLIPEYQHPISFIHTANKGYGITGEIGLGYRINKMLEAKISGRLSRYKVKNGYDYLFYANGNIAKTRLNEVIDRSGSIGFQLAIHL